ncbi:MarR family winged helix-turn-helix transcriptional regulator [Brevibacillus ginsengisoli]|uniref:MarR family winged helix-turn-helix transcriptional regulator n=1 Tax=Brevibacillus ginsengisoli TaxID=363854 RepID=UPI003CE746A3
MTVDLRDLLNKHTGCDRVIDQSALDHASTETLLIFMKTFRDIYTEMEARLSQFGITQGRFILLKIMYQSGEAHLTPSELAERAGVTRGTVSGLIDGLERDGLIERKRPLGNDRRIVTVQLTQTGWKLMDQLLPYYVKGIDLLMSSLTEEDHAVLSSLMDKLQAGLEKVRHQLDDSI